MSMGVTPIDTTTMSIITTSMATIMLMTTAIGMAGKRRSVTCAHGMRELRKTAGPSTEAEPIAARFDPGALYRLMAWLSPSYPVGAFSYSSGIEWAVEAGDITNADTLRQWIESVITSGSGFCDAAFFRHAHAAAEIGDMAAVQDVAELAAAFTPSKERHLETTAQGRAFLDTTRAAWPCVALDEFVSAWPGPYAYPVAVAVAAAGHGIPCAPALHAYLLALVANVVSAGVRLIPLGQTDGQRTLAALAPAIATMAERAAVMPLDDVGSATLRADIASMRHETQYTRLFRS
jgi:urease accessory protein